MSAVVIDWGWEASDMASDIFVGKTIYLWMKG